MSRGSGCWSCMHDAHVFCIRNVAGREALFPISSNQLALITCDYNLSGRYRTPLDTGTMQPYLRSGWTCRLASDHAKVYCSWMHVVVSATPVYRNHHFACGMVTGSGELGLVSHWVKRWYQWLSHIVKMLVPVR
jgi:hypothetical protein